MAFEKLAIAYGRPERVMGAITRHEEAAEAFRIAEDELVRAVNGLVPMELETAVIERSLFFVPGDPLEIEGFDRRRYIESNVSGWMYQKKRIGWSHTIMAGS